MKLASPRRIVWIAVIVCVALIAYDLFCGAYEKRKERVLGETFVIGGNRSDVEKNLSRHHIDYYWDNERRAMGIKVGLYGGLLVSGDLVGEGLFSEDDRLKSFNLQKVFTGP